MTSICTEIHGTVTFTYSCATQLTGTGNIADDPMFVDPGNWDFSLSWANFPAPDSTKSPCIDTGDPASPLDPDGTRADMGAIYFDQTGGSPLLVTLTPQNPPVQIPARGGSLSYTVRLENTGAGAVTFDAWTEVTLPNGNPYGPLIIRRDLVIPPGGIITRLLSQSVPGYAPAGNYTYSAMVGNHPGNIIASDSFPFVKLPGETTPALNQGWSCYGWNDGKKGFRIQDSGFGILSVNPNPFNSTTALSFKLQTASNVKLSIYDIAGREVAVLVEGFYPAGAHQAVWEASAFSSGIYFVKLESGINTQTKKLALIK